MTNIALFEMIRHGTIIEFFFFQAEDGIRDLVRSRGLGDVYKRQAQQLIPLHLSKLWEGKFEDLVEYSDEQANTLRELSLIHI